ECRDLAGVFFLAHAERVARGDGECEAEVEFFEELRGGFAVLVELVKQERVEGVVNGGGDFGGDDAVALRVDDEDAGGGVELREVLRNAQLFGAFGEAVR